MGQENINIKLKFYGPLKGYSKYNQLENISVKAGCTVNEFKQILLNKIADIENNYNNSSLIMSSAIADNNVVYQNSDQLLKSSSILILPPVCGG